MSISNTGIINKLMSVMKLFATKTTEIRKRTLITLARYSRIELTNSIEPGNIVLQNL